jgi:hypothetical protein
MAEKKNIVIKLKYPKVQQPFNHSPTPKKMVTEWNYVRIALALLGLIGIVALALYFFVAKPGVTDSKAVASANTVTETKLPEVANSPVSIATSQDPVFKKKIHRAQLTSKIVDSEPVGEVNSPVKATEKTPVPLYFFAELVDMKGQTVFHEWLLDGKQVSKKTVNISDNTWRTSSRQMVAFTTNSNWTVRLVDEAGQVITEKKFTVILDK